MLYIYIYIYRAKVEFNVYIYKVVEKRHNIVDFQKLSKLFI